MIKKRKIGRIIFIYFIIFLGLLNFINGEINSSLTWQSSAYDLQGTAHTEFKGNLTNPGIVWERDYTTTNIYGSVVADDVNNDGNMDACISAGDAYMRCFNASNGFEIWNYSIGGSCDPRGFSPLITDLFNDGQKQIVQGCRNGLYVVVNGANGTLLWNITLAGSSSSFPDGSPAAIDLDADGKKELLLRTVAGVYAIYSNGSMYWNHTAGAAWGMVQSGDINNDTEDELVFSIATNITIASKNGTILSSFSLSLPEPYTIPSGTGCDGPVLVDVNGDGVLDIASGSDWGWLYTFFGNGSLIWRKQLSYAQIQDGMAVADIDEDGKPELVIESTGSSAKAINAEDGSVLWTYSADYPSTSSPSIADMDNDGHLEVLATAGFKLEILDGRYGYSKNAVFINTATHHLRPALVDIDQDNYLDIILAGRISSFNIEAKNKLVAISNVGAPKKTSHKFSDLLSRNALNWKMQGKNSFFNNDIRDFLGSSQIPSMSNFAKISSVNFSIIADDLNNDGDIKIIAVNSTHVFVWFSNGTSFWNSEVGNSTNPIVSTPFISDVDDDNITDIFIQTKTTLYTLNSSTGVKLWNYTHSSTDINRFPAYAFDFDGDNNTEIFYFFLSNTKSIFLETNKTIVRSTYYSPSAPTIANTIAPDFPLADFNKDGIIDGVLLRFNGFVALKSMDDDRGIASGYVPGAITTGAVADINNDSFMDVIVGTTNFTWNYSGPSNPEGGNNPGLFALAYDNENHSLNQIWNFSSANVSSKIAVGDLNGDLNNEVIFGDANKQLYCLNATNGALIWNSSLEVPLINPPLIISRNNQRAVIVVTNSSVYLFNSSGSIIYNYTNEYNFSFSPIVADLNKNGRASMLIGDTNGNITLFNFSDSSSAIDGNVIMIIDNITYSTNQIGYGLFKNNTVNLAEYSTSRVLLETEGTDSINITLVNLVSSASYIITNINNLTAAESISQVTSDSNGNLNFLATLGGVNTFLIEPNMESSVDSTISLGSGIKAIYNVDAGEVKGIFPRNIDVSIKVNGTIHKLKVLSLTNSSVFFILRSEPQNVSLNLRESKIVKVDSTNLNITLTKILGNMAYMNISKAGENINEGEAEVEIETPEVDDDGEDVWGGLKEFNYKMWGAILLIVVLIVITVILLKKYYYSKNKNKY